MCMTLKVCSTPDFKEVTLHVVATYKYPGHYISDDLQSMMTLIDTIEFCMSKEILYCGSLVCAP